MSTTRFASPMRRKIAWTTPGRSGTPRMVIRASSFASAAPVTLAEPARISARRRSRCLGVSVNELRTWISTVEYFLANSIERECMTPRPQARQLEHLVVADPFNLPRFVNNPRVGGVNAVNVGVDLAGIGAQHRCQGHGRRVRTTPAQSGDIVVLVALEAGDDDDLSFAERFRPWWRCCGSPWCGSCRSRCRSVLP